MTLPPSVVRPVPRGRPRGIATLLIILVTGLSFGAVVLGLAYYIRSTQEQGMAMHAQTQAQIKAWTGAEVVRRYLNVLLDNQSAVKPEGTVFSFNLEELAEQFDANAADKVLPLGGIDGLQASMVSVDPVLGEFVVDITSQTGQDTRAQASSTLRLVYRIAGGAEQARHRVLDFMRNLDLSGSITVLGEEGTHYEVNVKGDVTTGGNSITGINIINSTGSIQLGSGSSFDELHANGDIRLTGSVSGQQNLRARGDICLSGGASATGLVQANGSVVGDGGVQFGRVSSIGASDNAGTALCGTIATDAQGRPYGVDLQGNSGAESVRTRGSVRVSSGSIGTLAAEGDLVDVNWGGREDGQIGGVLRITDSNPAIADWVQVVPGLAVAVSPVSPVVIDSETFNAYTLESQANYVFKVDAAGYKVVTVRQVAGIADGDYYIADYQNDNGLIGHARGYKDYLCTALAPDSTPQAPRCSPDQGVLDPPGSLCKGYSTYNNCMSATYDTDKARWTWRLGGTTFAPGVAWFEGDLDAGNGTYYNSFIATGDITTSGGLTVYAPAFAGRSGGTVAGEWGQSTAYQGLCENTDFPGRVPTQFCLADGSFDHAASGNAGHFAMMAGSCGTDGCEPYTGGDITLGASNKIHGSIKAGNQFGSGGSTTVHGYISALALGVITQNAMGASTTINLRNLPPGFDPRGGSTGGGGSGSRFIQVRWSRYL